MQSRQSSSPCLDVRSRAVLISPDLFLAHKRRPPFRMEDGLARSLMHGSPFTSGQREGEASALATLGPLDPDVKQDSSGHLRTVQRSVD